jgi:predicted methyltransferase
MLRSIAMAAALALAACASTPAPEIAAPDAALTSAVAGAWRTEADKARDGARRPAEALTFWGLKPGATALELIPGGGYWTDILAPYAKATGGQYQATAADLGNPNLSDGARRGRATFEARLAGKPDVYGQVTLVNYGALTTNLGAPNSVDFVLTARNIHNWMGQGTLDATLAQVFAVLKPGGVFAVEEHRANPGPQDPKAESGYVTEAYVIEAAERAGFKLAARSELLANPKDTKDHPFGVWTLPPVKRTAPQGQPANPAFDRTKYDAIGESDRMALRFVKPE